MTAAQAERTQGLRLGFFYGAIFAVVGVKLPYWPVWLQEERNLTPEAIGLLLGALVWPRAVAGLLAGQLSDRIGERRRLMVVLAGFSLAGFALFGVTSGLLALLALSLAAGTAFAGILPLGEASALETARAGGVDYPRVRLAGSLTFILLAGLGGSLIGVWSAGVILPLLLLTLALTLVACILMPEGSTPRRVARLDYWSLVRRERFWPALVAASLIQVSHAAYYGFATIHWRETGLGSGTIGLLWVVAVAAEVVLFLFATRLFGSVPPARLLIVAGLLATLRWSITAATVELAMLVLVQTLHAASFGVAHLAVMRHLAQRASDQLASAQGLYVSISAILMGCATPLAGWLYGISATAAFLAMAAISLAAAVQMALVGRRDGNDAWHA